MAKAQFQPSSNRFLVRHHGLLLRRGTSAGSSPIRSDIDQILATWRQPGQTNLLGASALIGAVKAAEQRARKTYYTHSFGICVVVLAVVIAVGFLGHMTDVFAFGAH